MKQSEQISGWHWIPTAALGGSDGSSIVDIARGTGISATDHFSREVIQNSWDAAQGFRSLPDHRFRVKFSFIEVDGVEAEKIRSAFDLPSLGKRLADTANLIQGSGSILEAKTFRFLLAEDFGAHGLHGHPKLKQESILYRALYNTGGSKKFDSETSSGGSFGFGKSAFINASASNTVLAYTCFEKQENDPTSRRFVGWTWHNGHEHSGLSFEGRAIFGDTTQKGSPEEVVPEPFSDIEADNYSKLLQMSPREGQETNEYGTSLAVLDPVINPTQLLASIEENWWPAIVDPEIHLDIEVIDYDGEKLQPRPRQQEHLQPLIRAFELATQPQDASPPPLQKVVNITGIEGLVKIGKLGLVAEQPDDDSGSRFAPEVRLMRLPRMVVGKHRHHWQPKTVKISAVFAISTGAHEADQLLKKTEPHFHDRWSASPDEKNQIPLQATHLAIEIERRITDEVNKFGREIGQDVVAAPRYLKNFSKLMGKFLGSSRGAPRPPEGESLPFSIRFGSTRHESVDSDLIRIRRSITLGVKEDDQFADRESVDVLLKIEITEVLSRNEKGNLIGSTVSEMKSKKQMGKNEAGLYFLTLRRGEPHHLEIQSDAYSHRTTADLSVTVEEEKH